MAVFSAVELFCIRIDFICSAMYYAVLGWYFANLIMVVGEVCPYAISKVLAYVVIP